MRGSLVIPVQQLSCPYCGHVNRVALERSYEQKIVACDIENGGCDQYFIVFASAKVVTTAVSYKIDGLYPSATSGGGVA